VLPSPLHPALDLIVPHEPGQHGAVSLVIIVVIFQVRRQLFHGFARFQQLGDVVQLLLLKALEVVAVFRRKIREQLDPIQLYAFSCDATSTSKPYTKPYKAH
jgi:hypothetical protein